MQIIFGVKEKRQNFKIGKPFYVDTDHNSILLDFKAKVEVQVTTLGFQNFSLLRFESIYSFDHVSLVT